jgi:hypothetical protein
LQGDRLLMLSGGENMILEGGEIIWVNSHINQHICVKMIERKYPYRLFFNNVKDPKKLVDRMTFQIVSNEAVECLEDGSVQERDTKVLASCKPEKTELYVDSNDEWAERLTSNSL